MCIKFGTIEVSLKLGVESVDCGIIIVMNHDPTAGTRYSRLDHRIYLIKLIKVYGLVRSVFDKKQRKLML